MSRPAMPYSTGAPMLTPAELQKFEAPLIAMANLSGGDLRKLFYAFFSFLNRRTDFYCILPSDARPTNGGGRMGFQEGQAEQILLASFRQFPLRRVGSKPATTGGAAAKSAVRAPMQASKPAPIKKDVDTEPPPEKENKAAAAPVEGTTSKGGHASNANNDVEKKDSNADGSENSASKKKADTKKDKIRYTDEGKQIPIGNGGSTSRYVWTQTLEEVTVHIPLPEGLRGKDLNVKIGATSLSIGPKGGTASESALVPIEGTLFGKIRTSESTWTLESSSHLSEKMTTLQLILEKVHKTWWATVISGDTPLIDTTLVDSTRHIGTYNDETQGEIRRILFDQRQERLGLETSQEMMMGDLPPLPNGEKVNVKSLPPGAEYIDQETLDKASITSKK
mmetsp:Transcript_22674/g.40919  ORF Transcript_22674/g.40919 Transcript_22674/m.40919 type:complete len:393 (-) Transcript_22674:94-1272(-)|eukprot:CAMPEP_0196132320 /NCGR_PEP_ID=MMETSP0910-20130528/1996_1 /TAXON_ID=49265 /ORGANISM="Thalassiosira rotula, Strain GSO102" /LENGTH=392 /DNA_ID=CAMNT_0041391919 /DNA_START=99 /DNA_END=1277 /DNA_ORIENTATION=-